MVAGTASGVFFRISVALCMISAFESLSANRPLVFREMWDTTAPNPQPLDPKTKPQGTDRLRHSLLRYPTDRGVPHISLVFREMWETTALNRQSLDPKTKPGRKAS